ncbi:MAG: 2-oxoacid:acceptor oxidoreductase subunit alpha [Patescibacteria group bacterium]
MENRNNLSWKIGGEAGFGIKSAGISLGKIFMKAGYEVFDYTEYPSLIRGGHNTYQLMIDSQKVNGVSLAIDVLVALNQETITKHAGELVDQGVIIFDHENIEAKNLKLDKKINLLGVPLSVLANQAGGELMRNVVAMGATLALVGQDLAIANRVIKDTFQSKGEGVVKNNLQALSLGFEYVKKNYRQKFICHLPTKTDHHNILLAANEAMALGALAGGLNFYAGYPMTPSSSILHYLAGVAESASIVVRHAEDEISVINMALGAAHVGARAMIATSGGGFALMVEALGLAGMTETPLVIINVMRPGPATGLPTWTEQGDLQFVLRAAQGDFPRIILAPGDAEEAFYLTAEALNLAEVYQTPVIILSDKFIGEGNSTVPKFDTKKIKIDRGKLLTEEQLKKIKDYQRYQVTSDGISSRALPGMIGGLFVANSDEHDVYGFVSETSSDRKQQVDKRQRKLETMAKNLPEPPVHGNLKGPKTIVLWGSTKGPVLDVYNSLPAEKKAEIKILQLQYLWPFPVDFVAEILRKSSKVLLIENNNNAQAGQLIAQETGIIIKDKLLKYDGRPFFREDLVAALNKL